MQQKTPTKDKKLQSRHFWRLCNNLIKLHISVYISRRTVSTKNSNECVSWIFGVVSLVFCYVSAFISVSMGGGCLFLLFFLFYEIVEGKDS